MSGITKWIRKSQKAMLSVKSIEKKFVKLSDSQGETVWPTSNVEQVKYGLRWVRDHPVKIPDARPTSMKGSTREANRFKLRANAQAKPRPIQEWIQRHGKKGTHSTIAFVDVPLDATHEEFKKLMDPDSIVKKVDRW
jgi:hypothetical protein